MQHAICNQVLQALHALQTQVLPAMPIALQAGATSSCWQGCSTPTSMSVGLTWGHPYQTPTHNLLGPGVKSLQHLIACIACSSLAQLEGHEEFADSQLVKKSIDNSSKNLCLN